MDSDDAQLQLIASLRTQIQDLFSQVTQLNGKLVKSYDRVSDLEDDLHVASSNLRASSVKISQLELERTQHLSALNTGLLVEKSHVTTELTRLMEKATEEAAQRGQAESARMAIEKDLDDLSAVLFDQANTMVAEARYAHSLSEQKLVETQTALKCAEIAVADMEKEVKAALEEKERWERNKVWERPNSKRIRLLASHTPYQEFLLFVAHLRSVHSSSVNPPAMSTLLPLPFLARLISEDSDPTIRLDLAPSLNWLSRRSVMAAIYNNQLIVESVSTTYLYQEATSGNSTVAGSANGLSCALCGCAIFTGSDSLSPTSSWSSAIFKRPSITSPTSSYTKPHTTSTPPPMLLGEHPHQIYVFRLSSPQTPSPVPIATISSTFSSLTSPGSGYGGQSTSPPPLPPTRSNNRHLSISSTSSTLSTASVVTTTTYPLCTTGWCIERLKHTVDLWTFVRRDIVGRVWEEEVPMMIPSPPPASSHPSTNGVGAGDKQPPPIPPRKRGLWGALSVWGTTGLPAREKGTPAPPPPIPKRSEGRKATAEAQKEKDDSAHSNLKDTSSTQDVREAHSNLNGKEKEDASHETKEEKKISPFVDPIPVASSSPTSTPLPPSRPSTPSGIPTPPPRSRPVSMAGLTGGGAPPPIPRRAAARANTGERAASPVPAVGSKLKDEAKEVVKEKEVEVKEQVKEEDKVEGKQETKEEEKEEAKEEKPKEAKEEKPEEVKKEEDVAVTKEEAKEATATEEAKEDLKTEATKEAEKTQEPAKEPEPSSSPLVNGHNDTPSPTDSNASTTPLVNGEGVIENHHRVDSTDTQIEDDRVWIGDATWEERIWKDLIKIREEMFWARVGGFRDR